MSRPPYLPIRLRPRLLALLFCAGAATACDATDDPPSPASDAGAGKGGRGGTAGTAGNAGNAGAGRGGSAASCSPCVEDSIEWGNNGGFVAFTERSSLSACSRYRHERRSAGGGAVMAQCGRELPCMGSGLHGISDVLHEIEQRDVVAALAKGEVLFGVDARPVDGQVFEIVVGDDTILVGMPCAQGASGCMAIPPGVDALAQVLRSIDAEQLNLEPCAGAFD